MDRPVTKSFVWKRLPHWEVEDGIYFVTISQYGAIPDEAAEKIRILRSDLDRLSGGALLQRQRQIIREMEIWLDRKEAKGDLIVPAVAELIIEAIMNRDQSGEWCVYSYVIMPNHIHLFMRCDEKGLFDSIKRFKRWTGHESIRILGHRKRFWAREWFDHWSRSPKQDERIIQYIRHNPVKAGLCQSESDWPYTR